MVCTPWLPPGGSCHDEISASRNRYFVVTDEGWRWLKVSDFHVGWRKPGHIPSIQLHSLTNLSPPLISLATLSSFPPGEAKRRLRKLIPFNVPICSRRERAAKRLYHLQIVYSCNRPAKLLYFLAFCRIMCYAIPGATSTPVGGSPSNFSQGVNFLFIAPNPKQRGGGRCVRYME